MEQPNQKQNEQAIIDPEVTITLKASEIYQLNLCVTNRYGYVQQRWSCATTETEQKNSEAQMNYLGNLSGKLLSILNDVHK